MRPQIRCCTRWYRLRVMENPIVVEPLLPARGCPRGKPGNFERCSTERVDTTPNLCREGLANRQSVGGRGWEPGERGAAGTPRGDTHHDFILCTTSTSRTCSRNLTA
jgi:hypothetical protein